MVNNQLAGDVPKSRKNSTANHNHITMSRLHLTTMCEYNMLNKLTLEEIFHCHFSLCKYCGFQTAVEYC